MELKGPNRACPFWTYHYASSSSASAYLLPPQNPSRPSSYLAPTAFSTSYWSLEKHAPRVPMQHFCSSISCEPHSTQLRPRPSQAVPRDGSSISEAGKGKEAGVHEGEDRKETLKGMGRLKSGKKGRFQERDLGRWFHFYRCNSAVSRALRMILFGFWDQIDDREALNPWFW